MTTSPGNSAPAVVLAAAGGLVDPLLDRLPAGFSDDELMDSMDAIRDLKGQLAALEAQVLVEIDHREIPRKTLAWTTTGDWFAHHHGLRRGEGRRAVAHARQLVSERTTTLASVRAGVTSPTQAGVICDALDRLPTKPALRDEAEQVLLEQSQVLDATQLIKAGQHVWEVIDPDGVERKLEASLAREEQAAHRSRFFTIRSDGAGGADFRGRSSAEDAEKIRAVLMAHTRPDPAVDAEDGEGCEQERDVRDAGARMLDALVTVCDTVATADLAPTTHGAAPRLAVTVPLEFLKTGLGEMGLTDYGTELSAQTLRRLACDAEIIPQILGLTGSIVLDQARKYRTVTAEQWVALVTRDRHCTFPGCTRPPVMCHAHHIVHWVDGGLSDISNYVLLCGHHHRVIHHTPWQVRMGADGHPEFRPPPRRHDTAPPAWTRHRPRRE